MRDLRSASLISELGSSINPYSNRLLKLEDSTWCYCIIAIHNGLHMDLIVT